MTIQTLFRPSLLLRAEGLAVFTFSILFYSQTGVSWWLFAILLLAPDVAMLGYLIGKGVGATLYNLLHFEGLPVVLAAYGLLSANRLIVALALIWLAHIGMDRLLGYGLKYASGFTDTHLSRV